MKAPGHPGVEEVTVNNNNALPDRVDELIDKLTVTVPHLTGSEIVREYCREAADALAAYNGSAPTCGSWWRWSREVATHEADSV